MNQTALPRSHSRNLGFERRLAKALEGEVRFDAFTRGRYATDASIYQILPQGVAFPKSEADIAAALTIAAEHGVPVIARGGGTSQNGQPIGDGLVLDMSRHFNAIRDYDPQARTVSVAPGLVLEALNTRLRKDGLFFPVEPSTASRCTIGGMAGNNSSGARSLYYGKMVDNVIALKAMFHDGEPFALGEGAVRDNTSPRARDLMTGMMALAGEHRAAIEAIFPKVQRRVGGYNLDELIAPRPNLSHLLVGSEGTLAITTEATLKLSPLPQHRVMGVCHFPNFRAAMETTRHIVGLGPVAVELVDNNVLVLGADIPLFVRTLADITRGRPNCLLLVEFAGDDLADLKRDLKRLDQCMADHGFPDAVVEVVEPARQKPVWEVREACLNIMMSMKGDGKPVSFIEDCAVPLEHLADYTDAVTAVFEKHGTRGTWYAHASVGCLHVRPILNMKTQDGVKAMRGIAEEACDLVRRYKGSFWRRHLALGFRRADVRRAADPRLRGRQGRLRPRQQAQSRQDRPFLPHGRSQPDALRSGLCHAGSRTNGARLVRLGRLRRRGRDVQQQRHLPEDGGWDDVPVLARDAGRAACDARPGQYAAARNLRPAWPRCIHLAGDEGDARSLRLLQGLQARLPDRRRHGPDEGRIPASLPCEARPAAEGAPDRLPAALCPLRGEARALDEPARSHSVLGKAQRKLARLLGAALASGLAQALARGGCPSGCLGGQGRWPRHRALWRHVQPLFRARES